MPLLTMAVFGSGHGFSTLIPAALLTDQFKVYAAKSRFPLGITSPQLSGLVVQETREILLQDFKFDLAVIAVPPFEQVDLARELVKNSSNLYIEKPAGLNSFEALALKHLAQENNCKIYVGFQFRFDPVIQHLKKVLQLPDSTLPSKISINWHTTGSSGKNEKVNWRNDSLKGGGVKRDFLVHVIDYLVYLFGIENLNKSYKWDIREDSLNRISLLFSGTIEVEIKISRGFVKESYWEVTYFARNYETSIKHSAPFSNGDYTSDDGSFLNSIGEDQKISDVRIQSTSLLFEAIGSEIMTGIYGPLELPTIQDALMVHKLIESIFSFPA
jgi:predicted dehydrogenase